jgi:hypothetical protein
MRRRPQPAPPPRPDWSAPIETAMALVAIGACLAPFVAVLAVLSGWGVL